MAQKIKIDCHTHSILSPDGAITHEQYATVLKKGILDMVAITDHHSVEYAQFVQKKLGEKIIVGEEMSTLEGHVIGLFLHKTIPSHLSLEDTIEEIKRQGGLVYIPHALDSLRHGIGLENVMKSANNIDIFEVFNARVILKNQNTQAKNVAESMGFLKGLGSDAHNSQALGYSYVTISSFPTKQTFKKTLSDGIFHTQYLPFSAFFYPKINTIRKYLS
ncbi:MAG TPA: PHP domain-containing protein [Patescibacteria group bacterium]|nr:PHP domain-containing protein [Patescibacteria group bacterium]